MDFRTFQKININVLCITTLINDKWQKYVQIAKVRSHSQGLFLSCTKFVIFEDIPAEESSAVSFTLELPLSIFFLYSYCIPLPSTQPSPFSQQSVSSGSISHSKLLSGARQYILYFTLGNLQGMQARMSTMKLNLFGIQI